MQEACDAGQARWELWGQRRAHASFLSSGLRLGLRWRNSAVGAPAERGVDGVAAVCGSAEHLLEFQDTQMRPGLLNEALGSRLPLGCYHWLPAFSASGHEETESQGRPMQRAGQALSFALGARPSQGVGVTALPSTWEISTWPDAGGTAG